MNQIIIYSSYASHEYLNYYHLIHNDKALMEYCPEEKLDNLFQKIDSIKNQAKSSEIYIVQDQDASEWDYFEMFQKYNLVLRELGEKDTVRLCNVMHSVLRKEFKLNADGKIEKLDILFYGSLIFENDCCKTDETLRQAEEILKQGGEERSELARIIKEKYERMKRHD